MPNEMTDRKAGLYHHGIHEASRIIRYVIVGGAFILCFWSLEKIADVWAGQETKADVSFSADIKADVSTNVVPGSKNKQTPQIPPYSWFPGLLGLIFGWSGIIYGMKQRHLRKNVVQTLHPYQRKWEEHLDSKRSTSELTDRGDTRKEDA